MRALALALALVALAGCERTPARSARQMSVPVNVFADTARDANPALALTPTLPMPGLLGGSSSPGDLDGRAAPATDAAIWMARVSPRRAEAIEPAIAATALESLALPLEAPPALSVDDDLKPPILRDPARLTLPRGARPGSVELDVRVDEQGAVSDAQWAGGAADSALVSVAIECALDMRFFPALQGGRPVAVWCRQRFDFTRR